MTFDLKATDKINKWFDLRRIAVPADFMEKSEKYCHLLKIWTDRINLISKNDLSSLVERHILDSLTPIDVIPSRGNLIDIGSGGGFPAIPIAFLRPNLRITMVESRQKKVMFLKDVIARLKLENVTVWRGRFEHYKSNKIFDAVTIRAVNPKDEVVDAARRLLSDTGKIIYYNKLGSYRLM